MRLSARNQLRGKIVSVQQGIVNALVTLDANGVLVSANITKASAQELGLEPGKDAIAVIKSTEVMIGLEKVRLSVRNQFAGKITSIELGAVNSIVKVAIEGGNTITSVISIASVKELGLKDDQVIIVESIPDGGSEADSTIVQLIDEGCNLIIGASSGFTVNVNAAAQQYPDVYFTQFEGVSADNYCSFTCWDIEAIFMCGYAAALMSDVDELGFVAAQPQASVVRAIDAWAAGAKAANPDATVQVAWVNSWYDPAGDKECANSLLQKGIKCLGYHGSTTAVAQAAQEAGAYCTGFHIDMHDYAPKAVLTSFCWNWTPIFNEIITSIATDSFTNDVKYANMADGAATIAPWNTDIMPEDVIAKCDEMKDKIVNGEYTVMAGPLSDNKGNELLKDGETFNLEQLIDCYWLLDNVIGDLP